MSNEGEEDNRISFLISKSKMYPCNSPLLLASTSHLSDNNNNNRNEIIA